MGIIRKFLDHTIKTPGVFEKKKMFKNSPAIPAGNPIPVSHEILPRISAHIVAGN